MPVHDLRRHPAAVQPSPDRPPALDTDTAFYSYLIADNNFRYYLNTNIFMQSQYNLQMSIRMLAERLKKWKVFIYLFLRSGFAFLQMGINSSAWRKETHQQLTAASQ